MDPGETLGNSARFVALQRADEVPVKREIGELILLGQRFLDITFAECGLSAREQFAQIRRRPGFRDCQQMNFVGMTTGGGAAHGNTFTDSLQVGGDCCHIAA